MSQISRAPLELSIPLSSDRFIEFCLFFSFLEWSDWNCYLKIAQLLNYHRLNFPEWFLCGVLAHVPNFNRMQLCQFTNSLKFALDQFVVVFMWYLVRTRHDTTHSNSNENELFHTHLRFQFVCMHACMCMCLCDFIWFFHTKKWNILWCRHRMMINIFLNLTLSLRTHMESKWAEQVRLLFRNCRFHDRIKLIKNSDEFEFNVKLNAINCKWKTIWRQNPAKYRLHRNCIRVSQFNSIQFNLSMFIRFVEVHFLNVNAI